MPKTADALCRGSGGARCACRTTAADGGLGLNRVALSPSAVAYYAQQGTMVEGEVMGVPLYGWRAGPWQSI